MVGNRIRELREEKEISQKTLSEYIKVSPSTIGMYEQGRRIPSAEILNLIAEFFNVSVDYLMGRTDSKNSFEKDNVKNVNNIFADTFYKEYKKRNIDLNKLTIEEQKKLAKRVASILSVLSDE